MAIPGIKAITIDTVTERSGFLGQRITTEEVLTLEYEGGRCILRQGTLEASGDSWKLFKRRLQASAREKGIPCRTEKP